MGLFGDLDIESAKDNPNEIPPNTYYCAVSGVKTGRTGSGKLGITFTYTIQDGDYKTKKFTEWKEIPEPADPHAPDENELKAMSYLKQRLLSFGIPSDKVNDVTPEDITGVEVDVSVIDNPRNPGFSQVRRVSLHSDAVDFTR